MEKKNKPVKEMADRTKNIDPVTLIIWGILLVAYGLYTTYNTLNANIKTNLLYIITPNLIVTFFGVATALEGYKREKNSKKKSD